MIKVEKGKAPDYLQSEAVDLAIEKLDEFYVSLNRSQKRHQFLY